MLRACAACLLALAAVVAAAPLHAKTIDVNPGPGTPLQEAIDAASDGDTVRVHAGIYGEAITVSKRLKLIGDAAATVTIDAGCGSGTALAVAGDAVVVKRMRIVGGTFYAIDAVNRTKLVIAETVTEDTCGGAEYGINLFQDVKVRIVGNTATGFGDAGIYVGGIPADGRVRVKRNTCTANTRGIIVEDSAPGAPGVAVQSNTTASNTSTGIFLHNSDGVRVARNTVTNNALAGIEVDATSDDNLIANNLISGSTNDVVDAGSGNCWRGNTFTTGTVPPCP